MPRRTSNRSRGGFSSKSRKNRSSVFQGIGFAISQVTENARALDGARDEYESGGDLNEILKAFYAQTGSQGDDKLAGTVTDALVQTRFVVANLAISIDAIVSTLEGLVETIDELMTRPLREIVEEDTDDG